MGTFTIVATPIGNIDDITVRAIRTLTSVDYILCEDTRKTGYLLKEIRSRYPQLCGSSASPTLIRCDEKTERSLIPRIVSLLESDASVALVSDAGTPLFSDPGYPLIRALIKQKITFSSIPGPSSVITALSLSGLPTHAFTFIGYPPQTRGKRKRLFESMRMMAGTQPMTYSMFVPPHKMQRVLEDMQIVFGDIPIVVARELTKRHEHVYRSSISHVMSLLPLKGEITLMFSLK